MPPQNQNYTSSNSLEAEPIGQPIPDASGQYYSTPALPGAADAAQTPVVYPVGSEAVQSPARHSVFSKKILGWGVVSLVALVVLATPLFIWMQSSKTDEQTSADLMSKYPITTVPLEEFATTSGINFDTQNVMVNATLQANNSLILTPGDAPLNPTAGQMYYDQTSNVLAYYDGTGFVPVTGGDGQVTTLGGASGDVLLGAGLSMTGNTLNVDGGVTSLQGATGDVTLNAGNGIAIDGLTVSNTGVVDLIAGDNVTITDNGDGTRTVNATAGGNVNTSGGTDGTISMFTSSNNIQDSILSQSGATITLAGSLNLGSALSVSSGGTGATSLASNGVLVGNGTSPILSVSTGTPDLCLRSTAGTPVWGSCGVGVTSLNGQTGGVNIANASGAGGTVTIDNASTSSKGIARFNSTNFTAVGGDINTVQNINTTASPTFASINTSAINPSGTLNITGSAVVQGSDITVGTAVLQGTINLFDSNGNQATIQTASDLGANIAYTLPVPSGAATTADICLSTGNCAGSGSSITGSGTAGRLAVFDAAQNIVNSSISESAGSINVLGTINSFALQGGGLSVGDSASNTAGSITIYSDNGNSITLDVASALTGNYTYSLPDAGQNAGICLTTGNCVGGGGGTAPSDAQYLTLATNPDLANERVLTPGANLAAVDGGAGGSYTIATVQNPTFTTSVTTPILQSSSNLAITSTGSMTFTPGSGVASVDGDFNLTTGNQYQIDGTQISSAALSNDNNLAKLSQSQTFTGNNNTFQNGADSTNAFAIQDAAGTNIFSADSTNGQIILGESNALTGQIAFNHQSSGFVGTLQQGALTADRTYTLADESGTICLQGSTNCGFATSSGSGNYIHNSTTVQTSANINIQGVGGSSPTAIIQDASVQSADLLQFRTSSGGIVAGVRPSGTIYSAPVADPSSDVPGAARLFVQPFSASSTAIIARAAATTPATGDIVKLQNSTGSVDLFTVSASGEVTNTVTSTSAFRVLNASSVPMFQVDTTNNRAYIGNPTADATGALLVLDTKNTSGDPTGVNGGMYYNSSSGKFRCFEASAWANCIGGGIDGLAFTSSGTFTKASYPGMKGIIVEGVGGGGGGGGAYVTTGLSYAWIGGGGGGGGYFKRYIPAADLAASETVTVGTGGAGAGFNDSTPYGTEGTATSFGSFCTADGGARGDHITASVSGLRGTGAAGGGATGSGCLVIQGGASVPAVRVNGDLTSAGLGGSSQLSGQTDTPAGYQLGFSGQDGQAYGGGGGGGWNPPNDSSTFAGGDGADGIVLITIYY